MAAVGWLGLHVRRVSDPVGGQRLRSLRERLDMGEAIVASALDIPRVGYFDVEAGRVSLRPIDLEHIEGVIEALAAGRCVVCRREIATSGERISRAGSHPSCWRERATSKATRQALRDGAARRSAPKRTGEKR